MFRALLLVVCLVTLSAAQSTEWSGGSKKNANVGERETIPSTPAPTAGRPPPEKMPTSFPKITILPKDIVAPPVPLIPENQTLDYDPYRDAGIYKGREYGKRIPRAPERLATNVGVTGKCVIWGHPAAVRSFDGRGFSFKGEGEFVLYGSGNGTERAHIIEKRHDDLSYVSAVGFRSHGETFSVTTVPTETPRGKIRTKAIFRWNNQDISTQIFSSSQLRAGRFYITHEGRYEDATTFPFVMTINSPKGANVVIVFQPTKTRTHLNVYIESPSWSFGGTDGLCGLWDLDPTNDFPAGADGSDDPAVWAQQNVAQHSLINPTLVTSDSPVLSGVVSPTTMTPARTVTEVQNATVRCSRVSEDFRVACVFNVLVNGKHAVKEALATQHFAEEHGLVIASESRQCLMPGEGMKTGLGPWGQFTKCSSKCGEGNKVRHRTIYTLAMNGTVVASSTVCGTLSQIQSCYGHCNKANIWGKCVHLGSVATFDGNVYVTPPEGEFVLYRSVDLQEQINVIQRIPVNLTLPVPVGAAFRLGPDIFEIWLRPPQFVDVQFRYNGRDIVSLQANIAHSFGLFTVRRAGVFKSEHNDKLMFEVRAGGGTTMTVSLDSVQSVTSPQTVDRMIVFVETSGNNIGHTTGMCGSYDFDESNDFVDHKGNAILPARFGWRWRVKRPADGLFLGVTAPTAVPPATFDNILPDNITGATTAKISAADKQCRIAVKVEQFRSTCTLDVLEYGPNAIRNSLDAIIAKDGSLLKPDGPNVAKCLAKPGVSLGPWSWWTQCSTDCGPGRRTRTRNVLNLDGTVCGDIVQTVNCMRRPCPSDCVLSGWTAWSKCSTECGKGARVRTRTVLIAPAAGGKPCGATTQAKVCYANNGCCKLGAWSTWSPCNKGKQRRKRTVSPKKECGVSEEVRECCDVWGWSAWSRCLKGSQHRDRQVYGPALCGPKRQRRACCSYSAWSRWTKCKTGKQTRRRRVEGPRTCGATTQTQACCSVGPWFAWTKCDPTTRTRFRVRSVQGPKKCAPKIQRGPCPAWELALLFPDLNARQTNGRPRRATAHEAYCNRKHQKCRQFCWRTISHRGTLRRKCNLQCKNRKARCMVTPRSKKQQRRRAVKRVQHRTKITRKFWSRLRRLWAARRRARSARRHRHPHRRRHGRQHRHRHRRHFSGRPKRHRRLRKRRGRKLRRKVRRVLNGAANYNIAAMDPTVVNQVTTGIASAVPVPGQSVIPVDEGPIKVTGPAPA